MILILGSITFLDPQIDWEHKAIIDRIETVVNCTDFDNASKIGEELISNCMYESYLIPKEYTGEIEMSESIRETYKQLINNLIQEWNGID